MQSGQSDLRKGGEKKTKGEENMGIASVGGEREEITVLTGKWGFLRAESSKKV